MSRAKASSFLTAEIKEGASWYKNKVGEILAVKPMKKETPYYFCVRNKKIIKKDHVRLVVLVRILVSNSWYKDRVGQTLLVYADPVQGFFQVKGTQDYILVQHCEKVFPPQSKK